MMTRAVIEYGAAVQRVEAIESVVHATESAMKYAKANLTAAIRVDVSARCELEAAHALMRLARQTVLAEGNGNELAPYPGGR